MNETRDMLERAGDRFPFPDGAFDRLIRRRARKQRNRRTGTFVLVAAIVILLAVVAVEALPTNDRTTGTDPAPSDLPSEVLSSDDRHSFVDVESGDTTPLPQRIEGGFSYAVSGDGTTFAFGPCCSPPMEVYVANVDGSGMRQMSPQGVEAFGIRWSQDVGSMLTYQGRDSGDLLIGNLFVVDPSTEETTQVTHLRQRRHRWWFLSPTFVPGREALLYHLPRWNEPTEVWDLWSIPVAGGDPALVRRNAGFGEYSPDGESLLYLSPIRGDFTGGGLWVVDASGGQPRALVEGGGIASPPRWSPDGTRIAYAQGLNVFVVDVATGRSSRVIRGGVPEWFDDDTLIVTRV